MPYFPKVNTANVPTYKLA